MTECEVTIINKLGLHARAAAKFVGVANRFESRITVCRAPAIDTSSEDATESRTRSSAANLAVIDGKSIMSVMMLAASQGTTLRLTADGADEKEALHALEDLINDFFGEGE